MLSFLWWKYFENIIEVYLWKKSCPNCSKKSVILWAKTKNNKRRWRCKNCQRSFVWENQRSGHRSWLKLWISGLTLGQVADRGNVSLETAKRTIGQLLLTMPVIKAKPNPNARLLIDGTFFKRINCLILYFDSGLKYFQLYRYSAREKEAEIESDLRKLKRASVNVSSVTTDGKLAIKTALRKVFPEVKFQRCLVHIQRYAETYITQKPKTKAGIELQEITKRINSIDSEIAMRTWLCCLSQWKRIYFNFLKEKSYSNEDNHWWSHRRKNW